MPLPINIEELINGRTVEWERIEFREGWNPERTIRTICAFANDFNNWGGGYLILGITEQNGQPILPPVGLELSQIDSIQQNLNQICRKILPNYFPIVEPFNFQGKKILIIWCPGGSNRPYKAPDTFGQNPQYYYYIRKFSSTIKASIEEERELLKMANQIPFDDQVNHFYKVNEFDLSVIKAYLNEVKSDLENEIPRLTVSEIARRMNIAEGSDEYLLPKNVGLLFFAKDTQIIFPSAKIEIVSFSDESGSSYTEKVFWGSLHYQLKSALDYLKDMIVKEMVVKSDKKAEVDRFFNYPYDALEEALCNAVYHRGYDNDSTIEVRIYPSRIDIISFPGPLPPLDKEKLKNNQFDVRKYRNRRIGEFLKELHLTEGRATGIPTIIKAMKQNNSPMPVFETDDARSYFKTSFRINSYFLNEIERERSRVQVGPKLDLSWHQVSTKSALSRHEIEKLLGLCKIEQPIIVLMDKLGWKDRTKFKKKFINPLLEMELLSMTIPEKPQSSKQKYVITKKGVDLLQTEKE